MGDCFSIVEVVQYSGGCSVQRGMPSVLWRAFSTLGGYLQYSGAIANISTVEGIQYSGGIPSVPWGLASVLSGDNISTVEVVQYNGDKDLKYYKFSKNLEIFSRAYFASKSHRPHRRPHLLTIADMVKDLGYKNLVLGNILR